MDNMKIDEEVILAESKDYNEIQNRFENPELTESEKEAVERSYQIWADGRMGRHGRLDDDKLSRFMEGKLHNMKAIMHASDKLVCHNGHVREKKETQEESKDQQIQQLNDKIDRLEKLIIEKLS